MARPVHALFALLFAGAAVAVHKSGGDYVFRLRTETSDMPPENGELAERMTEGVLKKEYSTNAACRKNHCINPLLPGLSQLGRMEEVPYKCIRRENVSTELNFCKGVVRYDPMVPANEELELKRMDERVKALEDAALTTYVYHLNAMGKEFREHAKPWLEGDQCIRAVWRMACFTYFPRGKARCELEETQAKYRRPCTTGCQEYLDKCQVECCDESATCVFSHELEDKMVRGYVDKSSGEECTYAGDTGAGHAMKSPVMLILTLLGLQFLFASSEGSPRRKVATPRARGGGRKWALAGLLLVISTGLQGCAPKHMVANWRKEDDYLAKMSFGDGTDTFKNELNSCEIKDMSRERQCSGRGHCASLVQSNKENVKPLYFCECEAKYADPECRTERKSQYKTFLLSLFLGWAGVDHYYLGFTGWGLLKMFTLGGAGVWWIIDIVRTGSGPVYADKYRVAADLPHWVFIAASISMMMVLGLLYSARSFTIHREWKRSLSMKMQNMYTQSSAA